MQPYVAIVGKKTPVNPSPLANRFNHISVNHNLSYETMRQHQARKSIAYPDDSSDPRRQFSVNTPTGYWDLRKATSLHNANLLWTTARQESSCTEPRLPWISGKELAERAERQAAISGTVFGAPMGIALPPRVIKATGNQKNSFAAEPTLHLLNTEAVRASQSLSFFEAEGHRSLGCGGGGGGNAREQSFSIWKAARAKLGGILGVLALGALVIMAVFAFLFWISRSIGLYVTNSTFGLVDYFWFSVRSFVTMSSPDLGPINSFGRMLANAEGLLGLIMVIVLSIFVGEKIKRLLGED